MINLIIIFIGIFSGIGNFVSATKQLTDPNKKGFKSITKWGWSYAVFTFILIALPPLQNLLQEEEEARKEAKAQKEQDERDAKMKASYDSSILVMKGNFDTSNIKTVTVLSEVLGRYGFALDSTNKRLLKVVTDSAKTRVIEPENPTIGLSWVEGDQGLQFVKTENGLNFYNYSLRSQDASSTDLHLKASLLVADSLLTLDYIAPMSLLTPSSTIPKNTSKQTIFSIKASPTHNYLIMWLRGSYKNVDRTKEFVIDEVYYNNKNGNTFGTFNGDTRERVIALTKQHEK